MLFKKKLRKKTPARVSLKNFPIKIREDVT